MLRPPLITLPPPLYVVICSARDWEIPPTVYRTIETLLPTGKGLFLELWAAGGTRRPGWTHVVESAQQPAPMVQVTSSCDRAAGNADAGG